MRRRFLIFGAHPDDCDILFGGTALKLIPRGAEVFFVSLTNGNAGHQTMTREALAERRRSETSCSAKVANLAEYRVLGHDDGTLMPTLENRLEMIRIIREINPDAVFTHRLCDYHPDHRAAGQIMNDASFLAAVPLVCPEIPVPHDFAPLYGYLADDFDDPSPFKPDAAVLTDEVVEAKIDMLACQSSQFFEWLPWCDHKRDFNAAAMSQAELRDHIYRGWVLRDMKRANRWREFLDLVYGDAGHRTRHAEFFSLMPVRGGQSVERLRKLLS